MKVFYCFLLFVLAIAFVSCKRSSDQEKLQQAFASITNPLALSKAKVESWAVTNANTTTNQFFTNMMLTGIAGMERMVTNEAALASIDAASFFVRLIKDGKAPGISKGEHGVLSWDPIVFETDGMAVKAYPAERTFHILKNGDTYTNNYLLIKESKEADWRLKRAWKVDLKGNLENEWPVQ